MSRPLPNQLLNHLRLMGAIAGGLVIGPSLMHTFPVAAATAAGGAALGAISSAGGALAGLLGGVWSTDLSAAHARELAGPKYAHPNNDLTRLFADAFVRVLHDCSEDHPAGAKWFEALAGQIDPDAYIEFAKHQSFESVRSDRIILLFEQAARTGENHSVDLLDDTVPTGKTVAWAFVEFLRDRAGQRQDDALHAIAEQAIIHKLFPAVREMLKRNPTGRAYAAFSIDAIGEVLARLGELARDQAALFEEQQITSSRLAELRCFLTEQANRTFYTASSGLPDDERVAIKVILDRTLAYAEQLQRLEDKIDSLHVKADRHQESLDALRAEMQRQLTKIAQRQQQQMQVRPNEVPALSDEDRKTLDQIRRRGDTLQKITAAALERQFKEANRLLDTIDEKQITEEPFRYYTAKGDVAYFAGRFDEAIEPYETALKLRPHDFNANNNAALAHNQARQGNIAVHQRRAIEIYEGLRLNEPRSTEWAMTQNNLGAAWQTLPTGDRACNLAKAIAAYEAALEVYTRQVFPADWATTQNNLGNAWQNLPTGDHAGNLAKAIAAYEAALEVCTRQDFPADWAMTQNNLGNAWQNLPTGDRADNLAKAIAAYEAALEVRTREDFPADWATTQNNLGTAWQNLPTGDRAGNLAKAIAAYEAALEVRTRQHFPADWATTQNNLGIAWRNLPTGDRAANLAKAIAAYEAALEVCTRQDFPAEWATTQNNLAIALAELANQPGQDRCALLMRAIASGKGALTVRTPDAFPQEHRGTENNLAIDRSAYEAAGCDKAVPFDDIPPAE